MEASRWPLLLSLVWLLLLMLLPLLQVVVVVEVAQHVDVCRCEFACVCVV